MTTQPDPTSFATWLATFRNGAIDDKLTAALREVAEAVVLHEKPGSIALKIDLAAQGGGVVVTAKVAHKAPEVKEHGQFFFVDTASGGLTRRDPNQPQLPTMEDTNP